MRALFLCLLSLPAWAAPVQLSHQGRLVDAAGAAVTGTHTLTFRLYAAETGGAAFWQEGLAVDLDDGYFHVVLGELSDLDATAFAGRDEVWLGITVDTGTELGPRAAVVAVPYAIRATEADGVVAGADLDLGSLAIDGAEVIAADGTIAFSALRDVPPDTLAALACDSGEIPAYVSGAWRCQGASAHTHDASALATGTIPVGRLPVGTTSGTVSAGDHVHAGLLPTTGGTLTGALGGTTASFSGALSAGTVSAGATTLTGTLSGTTATFTGAVTATGVNAGTGAISAGSAAIGGALTAGAGTFSGALSAPSATVSGALSAGSVTAGSASLTGALTASSVTTGDATVTGTLETGDLLADDALVTGTLEVGDLVAASAAFDTLDVGSLTLDSFVVDGTLQLGGASASCTASGQVRWTGSRIEVCDGAAWRQVRASFDVGHLQTSPAKSCKQILAANPEAVSKTYWIDGGGSFAARQLYCDMTTDGGGWTLVLKLNSSGPDVISYFNQPTNHVTDALTTPAGAASGGDLSDGLAATDRFGLWHGSGAREYRVTAFNASGTLIVDVTGTDTDPSNLMYHNAAGTPNPGTGYGNALIPSRYRVLDRGTTDLRSGLTYTVVSHGAWNCNCNESYRLDGDWNSGYAMWGDNLTSQPGRTNGQPIVSWTAFWVR